MHQDLHRQFGIDGIIRIEPGRCGLTKVAVTTPAAEADVYLHGAHVTHYQPRGGRPVLFVSRESRFEPGKPIRGGVPICFPWFGPKAGDPNAPMHGFARTREWSIVRAERIDEQTAVIALELRSDDQTRRLWPHDFVALYTVTVGPTLEIALEVTNTDAGGEAITFQEALHTYFSVANARQVSISGLENTRYFDKVVEADNTQGAQPIRFTGETDRVYQDTAATCVIDDPVWRRRLINEKAGSRTTVVWNPWTEKAKQLPDFGDDEWTTMACVETANAGSTPVILEPSQSHTIRALVRTEQR
jgi:glucose-6-phosphate 1-epimerase